MNVLIIYAHPNPSSFNAAILEHVQKGLQETNHFVTLLDLYKEQFNPVLIFNEDKRRRDLVYEEETEKYRRLIKEADFFIFIYPIWWWGMPAILKGFIDRVFVTGFAYKYEGALPKGLLIGKKAWVINTLDSPLWYVALLYRSADWVIMKKGILRFCGIRQIKRSVFQSVKTSKAIKREKWLLEMQEKAKKL
ncbi:NAD(P)H-dependent oxidoreductase [Bacillus pseudomycoides]|uniref:NAD(P)H-dependent oxidoreductase n=1 Tax=Bacillus pseudomycoides TaxID=64104 RepID=A0AAJ1Z304_9BACI|nr:NAD(P)H-dependent oxidoreductase [Bacillus pseudomycoides]KFN15821.1 putative oxidoreductase [Bacillus pseudomycoides]MDR4190387.1 NAD(P)H-dependent oxidoreductase [Bacillus pseudomycoides]MDR4328340.1 NAD(P)H-dependent oxidoreductase [Bacillus pseudomycoides]MED0856779.1 NAD(P)H-dependent oxidoreductase [Bacillus pseudomycoides]MED1536905.1 NAD(P)H-dependent oxidoreductase [Bacillus pseudomycoides]